MTHAQVLGLIATPLHLDLNVLARHPHVVPRHAFRRGAANYLATFDSEDRPMSRTSDLIALDHPF
jgi:hypothetical protein